MKVVCMWCEDQGRPAVLREEEPYDERVTRGLCDAHAVQLINEVRQALLKRLLLPVQALHA